VVMEAGKQVVTKKAEAMAFATLHDLISAVGDQTELIYNPQGRFGGKDWLLTQELIEIANVFHPASSVFLSPALETLTTLSYRSEYDRSFAIRNLVQGRSLIPSDQQDNPYKLPERERDDLMGKLVSIVDQSELLSGTVHSHKNTQRWRVGLDRRMGARVHFKADHVGDKDFCFLLSGDSPVKSVSRELSGFIQNEIGIVPDFIFDSVVLEDKEIQTGKKLWLIGAPGRLELVMEQKKVALDRLWQYSQKEDGTIQLERTTKRLADDCRIIGGRWLQDFSHPAVIIVEGSTLKSYETYFQSLLRWLEELGVSHV
jgi:hypothetical protein